MGSDDGDFYANNLHKEINDGSVKDFVGAIAKAIT